MLSTVHKDGLGRPVNPGDFLTDSFVTFQVVSLRGAGQFVYVGENGEHLTDFCCCFTVCLPPAPQSPGDNLEVPAGAVQGVCALTLVQFQRWLETEAHRALHNPAIDVLHLVRCRAAMCLLTEFKGQA